MSHKKIRYEATAHMMTIAKFFFAVLVAVVAIGICTAETTVYRLELTDEVPFIVGADGVRRQVVILSPDEYDVLKGNVKKLMDAANKTEESRIRLHGKRKEQIVEGNEKHTIYDDGYIFTEKMAPRTSDIRAKVLTNRHEKAELARPKGISDRHWEMMKKRAEFKKKTPRQVNIEHDALTGKDIVK